MSWLLMLLAGLALAFLLAPSLFRRTAESPVGAATVAGGDVQPLSGATVTEFPKKTFAPGSAMDRLMGSRSGYMGTIQ